MSDKNFYRKLLQLVNTPWILDDLNSYIDFRISVLHKEMEIEPLDRRVRELQGAISELRKLKQLRDIIREKAEQYELTW